MNTIRHVFRTPARRAYLLLLPLILVMVLLFAAGLVFGIVESLGYFPAIGMTELSLDHYRSVFHDPTFLQSLRFSLATSLISSVISAGFGVVLAGVILSVSRKAGRPLPGVFRAPIYVPHIIVALFVFVLLTQSGLVARVLFHLSIIDSMNDFPQIIFDKKGIGIMAAYIWKELPFMTYITYDVYRTLDDRYAQIAGTLGASRTQTLFRIILPQLWPAITAGFVMIFAYAFGSYEVPLLLGPTIPRALPVLSYIYYSDVNLVRHVDAMVVNTIITAVILVTLALGKLLEKALKKAGGWS